MKLHLLFIVFCGLAVLCRADDPKHVSTFENRFKVDAAAFSPDNKFLVVAGIEASKGEVAVWDVATKKESKKLDSFECGNGISELRFSPDGKYLSTTGYLDSVAHVWDVKTGREIWKLDHEAGQNYSLAWSPDSKVLAVVNDFGSAHLWNVTTGKRSEKVPAATMDQAISVAFSPEGTLLAVGTRERDRYLVIWDLKKKAFQKVIEEQELPVLSLAFTPDGTQLVAGDVNGGATIWDVKTWKNVAAIDAQPKSQLKQLFFHPSGRFLLTRGWWGASDVRIWDVKANKQLAVFDEEYLGGVAWSPDAKLVAIANSQTLKLWDTSNLEKVKK